MGVTESTEFEAILAFLLGWFGGLIIIALVMMLVIYLVDRRKK